jgi:phospholipid N-methyltransferase
MVKTIRHTRENVIKQMLNGVSPHPNNAHILEPSAGEGAIVEYLMKHYHPKSIDCVELNKEKREILKSKGFNVVGEDFLKFDTEKRYDYIIATPTFKNNVDIEHIMHMFKFLRTPKPFEKGGEIIALTYPEWIMKNAEHQIKFRKWLEDKYYSMRMLTDMSFVENYKTQPSMIISIKKFSGKGRWA